MLSPSPVWTQGMDTAILLLGMGMAVGRVRDFLKQYISWVLGVTVKNKTNKQKQFIIKVLSYIVEFWGMFAPTYHSSSF